MAKTQEVEFSIAVLKDLSEVIELLEDDVFGRQRESSSSESESSYALAFNEILADPNNEIIVGRHDNRIIAVLQITYIPNLTLKGSKRALIEGVRVLSSLRGHGIGKQLFQFALNRAKGKGCKLAQLTTNKARTEAFHFYESIGFKATHEGFKLSL